MKIIISIILLLASQCVTAQIFNPNPRIHNPYEFNVPVQPYPGYGMEGKGLHSAVPHGIPGVDCIVNPVSLLFSYTEVDVTEIVAGQVFTIPVNVLFDFDKDIIRPEGMDELLAFYKVLIEGNVEEIEITGHTDSRGTEEYNQKLGLRRAAAVAVALVTLGFDYTSITINSAGENLPRVANEHSDGSDNPEGRQVNRRVEIEIIRVADQEIVSTKVVKIEKNPQIFHRLASNNSVLCVGGGIQTGVFIGNGTLTPGVGIALQF